MTPPLYIHSVALPRATGIHLGSKGLIARHSGSWLLTPRLVSLFTVSSSNSLFTAVRPENAVSTLSRRTPINGVPTQILPTHRLHDERNGAMIHPGRNLDRPQSSGVPSATRANFSQDTHISSSAGYRPLSDLVLS